VLEQLPPQETVPPRTIHVTVRPPPKLPEELPKPPEEAPKPKPPEPPKVVPKVVKPAATHEPPAAAAHPPPLAQPVTNAPPSPADVGDVVFDGGAISSTSSGGMAVPAGGGGGRAPATGSAAPVVAPKGDAPVVIPDYEASSPPLPQGRCAGKYTEDARVAGVEGVVLLDLVVGEDGKVRDIVVTQRLGHGLDEAAVSALKACRFTPGEQAGKPVAVRIRGFKARFVLNEAP
jgi:protein TonB